MAALLHPCAIVLCARTCSFIANLKLPRRGVPARGAGRRSWATPTTRCFTYRGEDSTPEGRREAEASPNVDAAPPLKANRAFLSDPFCTIAEDSEGLPVLVCPVEEGDPDPELGPTFRYVEWDFTAEHGRGTNELCSASIDLNGSTGGEVADEDADEDAEEGGDAEGINSGGELESEEEEEEECDMGSYGFAFAAKMAKAKGVSSCFVGEDEDGMPALDCSLTSGR
mmetsp:Transcript_5467/g.13654  ORF Transcript_5467/g.13654 Transcript_5467/m.13654 type:complete len:226 (-) Transcript_5467:98-775(-)